MNLINKLRGGHCFGSPRTRRNTGGKITTFKLGHPVFDGGIRWCMFTKCFYQNGVNFLPRLALQKKINSMTARVSMLLKSRASPDMLPSASVTRKDFKFGTLTEHFSNETIDFVQRHWEVGRANDLSAPTRTASALVPSNCLLQCSYHIL